MRKSNDFCLFIRWICYTFYSYFYLYSLLIFVSSPAVDVNKVNVSMKGFSSLIKINWSNFVHHIAKETQVILVSWEKYLINSPVNKSRWLNVLHYAQWMLQFGKNTVPILRPHKPIATILFSSLTYRHCFACAFSHTAANSKTEIGDYLHQLY